MAKERKPFKITQAEIDEIRVKLAQVKIKFFEIFSEDTGEIVDDKLFRFFECLDSFRNPKERYVAHLMHAEFVMESVLALLSGDDDGSGDSNTEDDKDSDKSGSNDGSGNGTSN